MKYTLFLCGGRWQLPWFEFLKRKGHRLILVDPYATSPCVPLADVFFQEDVKNVDSIVEFVNSRQYEIEFVTSEQTDVSTLPVALISEALGLKGNASESVHRFTNKRISREFLRSTLNSNYPDFMELKSMDDLKQFIDKHGEVIIKPEDAQSSRGIHKLTGESSDFEIESAYSDCLDASPKRQILAEQFIHGEEITIEGVCINHQHTILTGSNKKHFRMGIASELNYPLTISSGLRKKLYEFHNSFVESTQLNTAITHAEYIINEKENTFYLVEVACRGGGSHIPSHIVPMVTGFNLYEVFYEALYQQQYPETIQIEDKACVSLHFFEFQPGKVKKIKGVEACKNFDFLIDFGLEFSEGDQIKSAKDDRSRQGYAIVSGITKQEVADNIQKLYNNISIEYES